MADWHALAGERDDCYRHKSRASIPPEVMLKIMILQYLYDLSDRQFEEQLRYRIDFFRFLGLVQDEAGPDHSTLSRVRLRRMADEAYDLPRNHQLLKVKRIGNRIIRKRGGGDNTGRYVVERVNAEMKRWCGGGPPHVDYWGLEMERVGMQMTLAFHRATNKNP